MKCTEMYLHCFIIYKAMLLSDILFYFLCMSLEIMTPQRTVHSVCVYSLDVSPRGNINSDHKQHENMI